jgi:hypothetical protein
VAAAVNLLTRSKGQSYDEYIDQIIRSQHPIATVVKITDITNNLKRLHNIADLDERERLHQKYMKALERLSLGGYSAIHY